MPVVTGRWGGPIDENLPVRSIRSLIAALTALAAGLLIGACGSSGGSGTVTVTHGNSSATTSTSGGSGTGTGTTTTPTGATTSSTPTSTTSTSASTPACVASMLALSEIGNQGATGHIEVGLSLKNTSSGSCHTYGYPGVQFLDKAGGALPTKSTRTTSDFAGHVPLGTVVVAPGDSVSFRLLFSDSIGGGSAGCTTAYGIQVIAPDDTHTLTTTIPGGVPECGTTTVSPVAPGTSAYQ
jgi:hypothetical protein